jgi:hypothetical protein
MHTVPSPLGGTYLRDHNGPPGSDDPLRAADYDRCEFSSRHRYPLKVTRGRSPLAGARRYLSFEGEVKVKETGESREPRAAREAPPARASGGPLPVANWRLGMFASFRVHGVG